MHEINFKLGPMSKSCFFVPNAGTKKAVIYNVLKIPISMAIITQGKYRAARASERGNKFSPLEVLVHSLKLLCEARHIGTTCRVLKKMI